MENTAFFEKDSASKLSNDEPVVSDVLRFLIKREGITIPDLASKTGISEGTLYSMTSRRSSRANVRTLKSLAECFGEDLSIFCGLEDYAPPQKLSERELQLLATYNLLTDAAKDRFDENLADVAANPKNRREAH